MSDTDERSSFELLFISRAEFEEIQTDELFEVRRVWDSNERIWYYSISDFIRLLTKSKNPAVYWSALKKRHEQDEGFQAVLQKVKLFHLRARDGRLRVTECVNRETMLRITQDIPSPLAEKVRLWLAQVGEERLQEIELQTQEDELRDTYLRMGRTKDWIDARIRNLVTRNALTDEWVARGAVQHLHFGVLSTTLHEGTFGIPPWRHHQLKQLPKSVRTPRDHYTEEELGVLTLAELAARRLHEQHDSQGVKELLDDTKVAGDFGRQVREAFEETIGGPVVSSQNFLDQPKGRRKKGLPPPGPEQGSLFAQGEQNK